MRGSDRPPTLIDAGARRPGARAFVFAAVLLVAGTLLVSTALADLHAVRDLSKTFASKPVLVNSRAGRFVVRGVHMMPGQTVRGRVRIRNKGTKAGVLYVRPRRQLDTPGFSGGELSGKLLLTIKRVGRNGRLRTVWRGYLSGMGKVRLGLLQPGSVRRYRFIVYYNPGLPARGVLDAEHFEGSRFTTDFVWTLVSVR
jgi:hypothetical protein